MKPHTALEVKRTLRGESAELSTKNSKKDVMEALAPRVNISNLLNTKILSDLEDSAMKHRQEAKDAIEKILTTANNRILPTGLGPLISVLKGRMSEPCKNLAKGFIVLVGNLAIAMSSGFKQYSKIIIQPLIYNLSDKQSGIRTETMIAIDNISSVIGPEFILNDIPQLLEKDNPDTRVALLSWVLKNKNSLEKCEVQGFVGPLVAAMQDRSKEIRVLAEQVVEEAINFVGYESFESAIQDLKPIVKTSLQSVLDKYKPGKNVEPTMDTVETIESKHPDENDINEIENDINSKEEEIVIDITKNDIMNKNTEPKDNINNKSLIKDATEINEEDKFVIKNNIDSMYESNNRETIKEIRKPLIQKKNPMEKIGRAHV